jgi:hypothetical protein
MHKVILLLAQSGYSIPVSIPVTMSRGNVEGSW